MGQVHPGTVCGYCGKEPWPHVEAEHVLPTCLYTSHVDPTIQRLTIPACPKCNRYWSKYEPTFRDLVVMMGSTPTAHHLELLEVARRSFEREKFGPKAFDRLVRTFVTRYDSRGRELRKIAPFREPSFALVMKKIVRGLCYAHRRDVIKSNDRLWVAEGIDDQIPQEQLTPVYEVSEIFRAQAIFFGRRKGKVHSAWVLDLFENRFVIGVGWRVERRQRPWADG